jgi:hypothetical protein
MLHLSNGLHLGKELAVTKELVATIKPLYRDSPAFRQRCLVDSPIATLAYDVQIIEIIGSLQDII